MNYTYKKFPELQEFDKKEKQKAFGFCIGKSKLIANMFFPGMFLVFLITLKISELFIEIEPANVEPIKKFILLLIPMIFTGCLYMALYNHFLLYKLVQDHVQEYKNTKT